MIDAAIARPAIVKSAVRALAVLEFFDDVRREARVGEIAERLGFPQSSASYLLRSLVEAGFLEFDASSRGFRPTPRVALLGYWISGPAITDGTLIRLLRGIADETQLTVTLAARNGIYAQYIHVLERNSGFPVHIPVGTCRLLVWSAAGFALLAHEDARTIRALVQRTNAEVASSPVPISLSRVLDNVDLFRRQGHFVSDALVTPGGGHVSMALPKVVTGGRNLVIGAAGLAATIKHTEREVVSTMRRAIIDAYPDAASEIEPKPAAEEHPDE